MSREQVEEIISPFLSTITSSIKKGFTDYMDMVGYDSYTKERVLGFNGRTKATLIHNLIIERIRENFAGVTGITAKEYKGVFGLHIRGQLFIRFNKFNSRLQPTRAKTKQRIKFENQQTVIPGFPRKPMFLYAGYTFTSSMTGIGSIHIASRLKEKEEWRMDVYNHLPVQMSIPEVTTIRQEKLVKIKKQKISRAS
jgi:hypothetical protein